MGQVGSQHICGHCGTVNVPGEQFCSNCGYDLSSNPGALANPAPTPTSNIAGNAISQRITGMLKSGEMLNGRYRVVRLVGKGGFGAVYEAHDVRFQSRRTIAVKEMSNTKLSPAERVQAIKDFRREADLLVQLNDPNLPHVSDFFEESDIVCLAWHK